MKLLATGVGMPTALCLARYSVALRVVQAAKLRTPSST